MHREFKNSWVLKNIHLDEQMERTFSINTIFLCILFCFGLVLVELRESCKPGCDSSWLHSLLRTEGRSCEVLVERESGCLETKGTDGIFELHLYKLRSHQNHHLRSMIFTAIPDLLQKTLHVCSSPQNFYHHSAGAEWRPLLSDGHVFSILSQYTLLSYIGPPLIPGDIRVCNPRHRLWKWSFRFLDMSNVYAQKSK